MSKHKIGIIWHDFWLLNFIPGVIFWLIFDEIMIRLGVYQMNSMGGHTPYGLLFSILGVFIIKPFGDLILFLFARRPYGLGFNKYSSESEQT